MKLLRPVDELAEALPILDRWFVDTRNRVFVARATDRSGYSLIQVYDKDGVVQTNAIVLAYLLEGESLSSTGTLTVVSGTQLVSLANAVKLIRVPSAGAKVSSDLARAKLKVAAIGLEEP